MKKVLAIALMAILVLLLTGCESGYRTDQADRTEKGEVNDARYIIAIQSGVCYHFRVIDNVKSKIV